MEMEEVDVPPRYERSWVHLKKSVCTLLLLRPRLGQNIGAKDAEIEVKGVQGQSGGRPSQSTRKSSPSAECQEKKAVQRGHCVEQRLF